MELGHLSPDGCARMLCGMSILTCSECACPSDEQARGWEGHLVDLDDDGEDEVVSFCPACAAREFGRSKEV
jgi:hypothetical protein